VITGIGHEKDDSIVDMVAHTRLKTPTAVAEFLISGVAQFDLHLDEINKQFIKIVTDLIAESKNNIEQITRMIAPLTREKISKANNNLNQTIRKLDNSVKKFIQNRNYQLDRKEETVRHEFKNFAQLHLRVLERTTRTLSGTLRQITIAKHDQLNRKMQRSETLFRGALSDSRHYLELSLQMANLTDPNKILARGYSITTYNGHALKDVNLVNSEALIETRFYNGLIISEVKTIKKSR